MTLKPREMIRLYEGDGWIKVRQTGSHLIMKKGERIEVIPFHNKELKKGLERKLLKNLSKRNLI